MPKRTPCEWSEDSVDPKSDHFEILYGDPCKGGPDEWTLVALVGRSSDGGRFNLEFLIDRADSKYSEVIKSVVEELNFYLVEKGELNPWNYMIYHCGTTANLYSKVHWSFYPSQSLPKS